MKVNFEKWYKSRSFEQGIPIEDSKQHKWSFYGLYSVLYDQITNKGQV